MGRHFRKCRNKAISNCQRRTKAVPERQQENDILVFVFAERREEGKRKTKETNGRIYGGVKNKFLEIEREKYAYKRRKRKSEKARLGKNEDDRRRNTQKAKT